MTNKPTMLSVVSEWWQWSSDDVETFRAWAALNRDEAIVWLRQEAVRALDQQKAGHRTVEDWIAHGRRKHA
jgi:hypothetical protein